MHKLGFGAALVAFAFSSTAFAQEEPSAPPPPPPAPVEPPPSPGRSPQTQEAPTVAPASDPTKASAATQPGLSITEPPRAVPQQYPALGGHLGFAFPIATFAKDSTVVGKDFVNVGLTPGITLHLDDKWAIDFEFIAFNSFKAPASHGNTTFVVDPGIIRKFDGFTAGLRVATQVGAQTNSGIVPIFVLPIKVSKRSVYFFELDVPLFVRDTPVNRPGGGNRPEFSATILLQSGFGF